MNQTDELLIEIRQRIDELRRENAQQELVEAETFKKLEVRLAKITSELNNTSWMCNICAFAACVWLFQQAYRYFTG